MQARIYYGLNTVNNKIYIGYTSQTLKQRVNYHRYAAFSKLLDSKIYRAIRKYGWEAFEWGELYVSWDKEYCLNTVEPQLIQEFDSIDNGYNTDLGGGRTTINPETRVKISDSVKKAYSQGKLRPRLRDDNPMFDNTVYEFYNLKTGETYAGTKVDFRNTYNLAKGPSSRLANGKKFMYKYWVLSANKDGKIRYKSNLDTYTFTHDDGTTFTGSRQEFCNTYGLKLDVIRHLVKGATKKTNGWTLKSETA